MDDTYRSQFRLPYPLYEKLKQAADENHRSVNAELVARLGSTFPQWPSALDAKPLDNFLATAAQMPLGALFTPEEIASLAQKMLDIARSKPIQAVGSQESKRGKKNE
ncbi:Arc family DNA-binding protein [Burkholderia vietnamiensis]|uniref:Arc family DNA-binding protein n=1 Tax=Burkholderia vietnamiensis TaxID=60552 RepID=UPI00158E5424|nr:Arc family DNA-binding protein [Burkholderia vietnamiensis]